MCLLRNPYCLSDWPSTSQDDNEPFDSNDHLSGLGGAELLARYSLYLINDGFEMVACRPFIASFNLR